MPALRIWIAQDMPAMLPPTMRTLPTVATTHSPIPRMPGPNLVTARRREESIVAIHGIALGDCRARTTINASAAHIADDDGGNRHNRLYKEAPLLVGCGESDILPVAHGPSAKHNRRLIDIARNKGEFECVTVTFSPRVPCWCSRARQSGRMH